MKVTQNAVPRKLFESVCDVVSKRLTLWERWSDLVFWWPGVIAGLSALDSWMTLDDMRPSPTNGADEDMIYDTICATKIHQRS